MHFLLSSMSVVYMLTTPIPEDGENATVEQLRDRATWDNDDYVCRGLILNGMIDPLFDIYQNVESSKELYDSFKAKYMTEDASSKKFLVSCIIDKLPPSWKDFKHSLKHQKEELTLVELGSHLHIEESLRVQDNDKPKGNNVAGSSVDNMMEHNNSSRYIDNRGKCKYQDTKSDPNKKSKVTCWKCGKPRHLKKDYKGGKVGNKANGSDTNGSVDGFTNSLKGQNMFNKSLQVYYVTYVSEAYFVQDDDVAWWVDSGATVRHVHYKRMQDMSKDGLIPAFDMNTKKYKTCMLTKIIKKPFQKVKRENEVLELIHSDLCDLHATPSLENKKYFVPFIDDASRAVVRLPDPKLKTLGERGIKCIFVVYAEHSKAFRSSSIPRPSLRIPNGNKDISGSMVPEEVTQEVVQQPEPELRKSKRNRTPKNFRPEFQLYLIERTRDEKEAINNEMYSIMGNNTWVLADLPSGCKPLGCKWIFKGKLKVDGTIEKFMARPVIQGFRQKLGIDYFDTYAIVVRISTIRLLIAMASIHNLIIHQIDVKTTFLNGELDEEFYMNQPQGFIMSGNENKVCKLIKSLYGLKQTSKQWHQKFDKMVLSSGYLLNQANKCVYSKFDEADKRVIICLYVDDILIFGTDQVQVDMRKEFLSLRFSMKDIGGGRCYPSTPIDTSEKLMPNNGHAVSQPKYSRVIGCLMYAMTCTMPDIAFAVGKLSSNTPGYHSAAAYFGGVTPRNNCITSSTMESEFVALAVAGKEAEWLKNLILDISLWSKPITPISIRYDSAATLANAYSQMYNGKSRHLGVRYSMIRELIMNGVDSPAEETKTESNVRDDGSEDVNPFGGGNPLLTKETKSEPIIWDIGDEEDEYHFVNKYLSFQEEPIVLVEEESCPVYNTDNEEEESIPVYDTDIEDVIEEEEGFVGKGGFGGEEDNIEDVVVVANDHCSSMIQTILSVDIEEDINTKSHELMSFGKSIIIKKLYANGKKCHFLVSEVTFLGYIVTGSGIKIDPAKVEAIISWPTPSIIHDIRSFHGVVDSHGQIECDASGVGIGGVLSQNQRPIAFFSENLNDARRKYSTYDMEFYAIVRSLDTWRHYLLSNEFVLFSDHEALKFINGQHKLKPRHAKWVEFI
ncbi:zinc finger, CCHC-type containing protein [Tanacetum coccineum]